MHAWRLGVLAGHGAEQSRARTTYGGDSTATGRGSTTRPGGKRSATEGGLGCGGRETARGAGRENGAAGRG